MGGLGVISDSARWRRDRRKESGKGALEGVVSFPIGIRPVSGIRSPDRGIRPSSKGSGKTASVMPRPVRARSACSSSLCRLFGLKRRVSRSSKDGVLDLG